MAERRSKPATKRTQAPRSDSALATVGLLQPAFPESRLLISAEALKEILEYVTQQANACQFSELGSLVEKAHLAAIELVRDIKKKSFTEH